MSRSCIHCKADERTAGISCPMAEGHSFMKDYTPDDFNTWREERKCLNVSSTAEAVTTVPPGGVMKKSNPINMMAKAIHQQNKEMGWWDNPREMGTLLCLVHSEISEAMEGERKNLMDDHLPHRSMLEVELADAMIRIMDIAASRDLDLAGAIVEKVAYNRTRADHQPGARAEACGKKF